MPSDVLVIAAVAGTGSSSAAIDCVTRRVPNWLTGGTAVLGLATAGAHLSGISLAAAAGGCVLGAALMLPGHVFGATGAGDVKLLGALGTLLGPTRTGLAFVYAAMAGGVLAVIVAAIRGRLHATFDGAATFVRTGGSNVADLENPSTNNRFAYAPALAIGAIVAAVGL